MNVKVLIISMDADECVKKLRKKLVDRGYSVYAEESVAMNMSRLRETIYMNRNRVDVIFTVGGTGLKDDDTVPEATINIIDRRVKGLEFMLVMECVNFSNRLASFRGVVGTVGNTLVMNLPADVSFILSERFDRVLDAVSAAVSDIKI